MIQSRLPKRWLSTDIRYISWRRIYPNSRFLFTASKRRIPGTDNSLLAQQRLEEVDRQKQLEDKIKQMQAYRMALKSFIKDREDQEAKLQAAELENIDTGKFSSETDIEMVADYLESPDTKVDSPGLGLFANMAPSISLPDPIVNRIGNSLVHISSSAESEQNWSLVVGTLQSNGGLKDLGTKELDLLLYNIPLKQRADLLPSIYSMVNEAHLELSGLTYGLIVAAYAEQGRTEEIDILISQMQEQGLIPNKHIYGNLLKSLSKNNNLERSVQVVELMKKEDVGLSKKILTTLMQTCIRVRDFNQADQVFDMMKFLSAETQPDLRVYSSMMLNAALQYNIERVLDLYRELSQPHLKVLSQAPTEEVQYMYNILIYACARDPRTYLKAWEFLLELQRSGLSINRRSVESLMYLCGKTGEIMLARAMFKQLCQNPLSYPSSLTVNSLFTAYSNFKPGQLFSTVLASPLGAKVQSNFVFDEMVTSTRTSPQTPPFLPSAILNDRVQVLAESRAMIAFFHDHSPHLINERLVVTYLKIPFNLENISEFKYRYESETFSDVQVSDESASTDLIEHTHSPKVARNHYIYDLAIRAAAATQDIDFGTEIWEERGAWRKSDGYRALSKKDRDHSDFLFAQRMVSLFTNCGEFEDAFKVVQSTAKQFKWKMAHVSTLSQELLEMDDEMAMQRLRRLVSYHKKAHRQYKDFHDEEEKHDKRAFARNPY